MVAGLGNERYKNNNNNNNNKNNKNNNNKNNNNKNNNKNKNNNNNNKSSFDDIRMVTLTVFLRSSLRSSPYKVMTAP